MIPGQYSSGVTFRRPQYVVDDMYSVLTCSMCMRSKAAQHVFVQDNAGTLGILSNNIPSYIFGL